MSRAAIVAAGIADRVRARLEKLPPAAAADDAQVLSAVRLEMYASKLAALDAIEADAREAVTTWMRARQRDPEAT